LSGLRELALSVTPAERLAILATLSPDELLALLYDWPTWARPSQLPPPGDWRVWLILSGRGWGKTRCGSEWIRSQAREHPECRLAVVARTSADTRDVCVEGESGVLAVHPPSERPLYEPSKRRVTWRNGSQATCYSADEPDLLRGPQHHAVWADEVATWSDVDATWSNLQLGLRLGTNPRVLATTTPRPIKLLRDLIASPSTVVTRGSTFDNAANLAASALAEYRVRYEGTRLGRQELSGELLWDVPGALWSRELLDASRVQAPPSDLQRIVVGVDPAVGSPESGGDLTGIVAVGRDVRGHLYVLRDASCRATPAGWAARAVALYDEVGADRIIAEANQGGAMVESTIKTVRADLPVMLVHASRGKITRGEPVSALWEQGRGHIVGVLSELEDELSSFAPGLMAHSPDRADAMVWACSSLMESGNWDGLMSYYRDLAGKVEAARVAGNRMPRQEREVKARLRAIKVRERARGGFQPQMPLRSIRSSARSKSSDPD
jgi:phage terminase large subunit-like protein